MFHIHSITEVLVSQWIKARLEAMYLRQSLDSHTDINAHEEG